MDHVHGQGVHMKAERPTIRKKTFKIEFLIWQLLVLERTLLSELPRIDSG